MRGGTRADRQTMHPSLDQMHDIVLPEAVSWMPQTAGWWILAALVLAIGLRVALVARRRHRENRYRRLALAELDRIEAALGTPGERAVALGALPALVKRTALAVWPRETVASLSGAAWLRFLDESYGGSDFTKGPGRSLPALAYARDESMSSEETRKLTVLVRDWIRRHRVRV